jgi:lysophospholipase L1-like esterase
MRNIGVFCVLLILGATALHAQQPATRPATAPAAAAQPLNPNLPTLFIIGDSTASNGPRGGWGSWMAEYFDLTKVNVTNRALGGRSSRSFINEGHWEKALADMKPGDWVLIQWGQNDGTGRPVNNPNGRPSLYSLGEETEEVTKADGTKETVHTFGWYIRKYIAETRAKGATPILLSLTAKNIFDNGKNRRPYDKYPEFAMALSQSEKVQFLDHQNIVGEKIDALGEEKTKAIFTDTTHTRPEGADMNAAGVIAGLKALDNPLMKFLSEKGKAAEAYKKPAN